MPKTLSLLGNGRLERSGCGPTSATRPRMLLMSLLAPPPCRRPGAARHTNAGTHKHVLRPAARP